MGNCLFSVFVHIDRQYLVRSGQFCSNLSLAGPACITQIGLRVRTVVFAKRSTQNEGQQTFTQLVLFQKLQNRVKKCV